VDSDMMKTWFATASERPGNPSKGSRRPLTMAKAEEWTL